MELRIRREFESYQNAKVIVSVAKTLGAKRKQFHNMSVSGGPPDGPHSP